MNSKKIFVMGRPGSGKSTVAALMAQELCSVASVFHRSDYTILYDMYVHDTNDLFNPADSLHPELGFDIKNPMASSVWNTALRTLETQVTQRMRDNELHNKKEYIILEFSRREYREALKQFSAAFLRHSCFLFVEASIPVCIQRIRQRALDNGDGLIGDDIISGYYGFDNYGYMKHAYILGQSVSCIVNESLTKGELRTRVCTFLEDHVRM